MPVAHFRTVVVSLFLLAPAVSWSQTFEFTNPVEIKSLFDRYHYSLHDWDSGNRLVPKLFLQNIPERWRKKYVSEMQANERKEFFYLVLAPLVLKVNATITKDRERYQALLRKYPFDTLQEKEALWLKNLLTHYEIYIEEGDSLAENGEVIDAIVIIKQQPRHHFDELLRRLDIVAPSLALAQAALETGWGVSRFADVGNALYGQWTWGEEGIKPMQQRSGKGNYLIKSFSTPEDSIIDYMHNLNTHNAYKKLRDRRAQLREQGMPITGKPLAETLVNYSERGSAYAKDLVSMIRHNKLYYADESSLQDMSPIYLVPVGAGAD